MMMNKEATKIGFAYVGIVVGAGFSTGQEVMQFFTKYGLWAYLGVIISGFILAFIGRQVAKIVLPLKRQTMNQHYNTYSVKSLVKSLIIF